MFHDDKGPLEPEYTPFPQTQEERFSGFYETGNIRPPKNHGGWVAAVLLTCIFLGGLAGGGEVPADDGEAGKQSLFNSFIAMVSGISEETMIIPTPLSRNSFISLYISAFAPTSTPRVGSFRIRIFGSVFIALANTSFC